MWYTLSFLQQLGLVCIKKINLFAVHIFISGSPIGNDGKISYYLVEPFLTNKIHFDNPWPQKCGFKNCLCVQRRREKNSINFHLIKNIQAMQIRNRRKEGKKYSNLHLMKLYAIFFRGYYRSLENNMRLLYKNILIQ